MNLNVWKKRLIVLSMGVCPVFFAVGSNGGCQRSIAAGLAQGAGTGVIAAGTNAAFDAINNANISNTVEPVVTNALQSAFNTFVKFAFPITVVQDELLRQ